MNSSQIATSGAGAVIVQVTGDGNSIAVPSKPHLELTRYTGRELVRFLEQADSAAWDWNTPVLAVIDNASASASPLNAWLRQLAVEVSEEVVRLMRPLARDTLDANRLATYAGSLSRLAGRLLEVGRSEEAVDAAAEGVALNRGLAAARPDAYRPDLARVLSNQSICLAAVGRYEEALSVAEEAVALERSLVVTRPGASRSGLATALNSLSNRLSDSGRCDEALVAIVEAVMIRRDLAATCPDAYGPELAVALHNLSECLTEFGRREEALDAIEDAVANLRRPFLQTLSAFAKEMETIIASYTERCAESNREVEAELLAPITGALARLKDDRPGKSA